MKKNIYLLLVCSILSLGGLFSCSNDDTAQELSTSAYILEAQAQTEMGQMELPITGNEILISVPETVDLKSVSLKFKVSEGATIYPDPSVIRDWSYKHTFTVTAANGDTKTYYTIANLINSGTEFVGSVRLSSQQEIDGFGSNGYTSVGDIYIYQGNGTDRITDFSALNSIKEIKGQLVVNRVNCREVTFANLERLGKLIFHAPYVTKLKMPQLKSVADDFIVGLITVGSLPEPHSDFSEIDLSSLEYVGGSLEFNYLTKTASLESLSKLTHIGKNFNLIGGGFKSLKGIEKIKFIGGNMEIFAKESSLDGFNIEEIKGSFVISNLESASSLKSLQSLRKVGGNLSIGNNFNVQTLEGLENIDVNSLTIENFQGLTTLAGIPAKPEMASIVLTNLPKVASLSALSSVTKVTTKLSFVGFNLITDLSGLNNLVEVGELMFVNNPQLSSFNGLSTTVKITGYLEVTNCAKISNLNGLTWLTNVGGLRLRGLPMLTNLNGLENLTTVTKGGIFIETNALLTDISALSNLKSISFYQQADKLVLRSNSKLADFCPLSTLIKQYAPLNRVTLTGNYYNPTLANFNAGNCSGGVGGTGISGGK